jgi:hypothetical protein
LANLDDHGVLTPQHAGVNLIGLSLADIPQSLAIELENLFRTDRTAIRGGLVARDSNP